ncbi:MAG: cyclic nucleotide-binding domain-containing protein [Candidatus Marinimicrobia bacterium]|nr:cyclic nucleotide-binding domain-containing protein [Candidatus Neomarinimicrobiota bacterium]
MEHIQIADGIHWVAIPEADLKILCGCPADSVKHLMKKGLIVKKKIGDVQFETGPNAILLSDILIQRGSFGNLAEFPVLQMLYLQGMILPNHPNNTGVRPLLMGAKNQITAQLQYIRRGNYGLISEEEIIATGIAPETAHQMMRLKLKFAFGAIHPTEDLLDSLVVDKHPTPVRNDVMIRRCGMNIYEFSYKDEAVTVDLNLPPESAYTLPYLLEYHHIDRNYFGIAHSGNGDGWDSSRPSMASILIDQGRFYLIDAGPHIGLILEALGISVNELEGIFHTHAHDDHFAGLTTLANSEKRLKYYATPLVRASVQKKLAALAGVDEGEFHHLFDVHDLVSDQWNDIGSIEVKPIISPHPVETNIFFFRTSRNGKTGSYAHLADIISMRALEDMITEDENDMGISREYFNEISEKYLEAVNLKKIDIGGELIHGNAEDFRNDPSDKITFAHTAKPLTEQQKQIGYRAEFGATDIIISSDDDFTKQFAEKYLKTYFPEAGKEQLDALLANPITTFEPGTVLVEPYLVTEYVYLVIGGSVEMIHTGINNILSAGALIGELSGLMDQNSKETYQAKGYAQALCIPTEQYIDFIKECGLLERTLELQYLRTLLQKSYLFGEALSYPLQTKLAAVMSQSRFEERYRFPKENQDELYMVSFGIVELSVDEKKIATLLEGDVFREEAVLTGEPSIFQARAETEVEIYRFPTEILTDIPIIRWKLFEIYQRRLQTLFDLSQD